MRRSSTKIAAAFVAIVLAIGVVAFWMQARRRIERVWSLPSPAIAPATDPEAIARGERIFMAACFDCHVSAADGTASGGRMAAVSPSLGVIYAANLTADLAAGIGSVPDDLVARTIRTGVRRDGRVAIEMPRFSSMADADVSALLGFLRSRPVPAVLEPVATTHPAPALTLRGTLAYAASATPDIGGARTGIPIPSPGSTLEYGRYLADAVYRCGDCHASTKGEPYVGGAAFEVAGGGRVVAPNLTPSQAHGIGAWTFGDFAHAVRDGIAKGGFVLRHPMPRLRLSDDAELGAIYAWLMSRPARDVARAPVAGELPRERVAIDAKPAELFLKLGCPSCHARGAPYAVRIFAAKGKPVDVVAAWIRNPQASVRGTPMPTFESLLTEEQSMQLAAWVLARLDEFDHPF